VKSLKEINRCPARDTYDVLFRIGLELDHAYSILDAQQVGSRRLVRLRNPWGKKGRNDALSDDRTKWPRILKEGPFKSSENDGVFWMRRCS
jgi:hypothetical protein